MESRPGMLEGIRRNRKGSGKSGWTKEPVEQSLRYHSVTVIKTFLKAIHGDIQKG